MKHGLKMAYIIKHIEMKQHKLVVKYMLTVTNKAKFAHTTYPKEKIVHFTFKDSGKHMQI